MEKNTLLAVVLSIAVFLVWSYFFGSHPQRAPQKPAPVSTPRPDTKETVPPPQEVRVSKKPEPAHRTAVPRRKRIPRTVTIEHPLYRAEFSEQGAQLISFRLKKYRETAEPDSPPLELLKRTRSLGLALYQKRVPGLEEAVFTADREKVVIPEGGRLQHLTFTWVSPEGVRFRKRFVFHPDSYLVDLEVTVENRSDVSLDDNLVLREEGAPFEKVPGYYNKPKVSALIDDKVQTKEAGKLDKPKIWAGKVRWAAYEDNYFITAMVPDTPFEGSVRMETVSPDHVQVGLIPPPFTLAPGTEARYAYHLYFGPKELDILRPLALDLDRAVDFGWFDVIAKPMLFLLKWLYKGVRNYGVAIIIITILIKILFWPLTHKSYASMKAMQRLQPEMAKLREQYKNDKQKLNAELMNLYKTHKVNPMGGCLPMLIQIPVFFALYRILGQSIEMRHAPFMLWINDLSAPDRLYVGFHIPYTGGLPVLTLLMGLSMFIQQKMTPTPGDPTQAKMMLALPVVFTFLFINFPSGLVLYWLVNNILSIGQQYYINKKA